MKKLRKITFFAIASFVLMSSLSAFAQNIDVDFNKVTINVNGEKTNGNNILYNDRTYVPLRAISEMLSKEVLWNDETKTIDINDAEGMFFKGISVGKMGNLDILSDEYKIFESIVKSKNSKSETPLSDEEIQNQTKESIKKYKAIILLMKENNLSLPKNISEEFDANFKKTNEYYMSQGLGENAFLQLLEFMGYTYDSYKFENQINKANSILSSHFSKNYSEEEMKSYYDSHKDNFKNDMVQAKHILLLTEGKNEEEIKTIETKAKDILAKIKKGEDFDKLMAEYCEDPGAKTNPEGYIFGKGEMVKEFEDAAFALKNKGDISDIIKSSYGFHIIKLVDRFDTIPFDKAKSSINSLLNVQHINSLIEEKIKNTDFSLDTNLINQNETPAEDEIFTPGKATVDVSLNSVRINVNGKEVNNDNIVYMGRTYVPLRAISEMLSKEVIWYADTNTADITDNYGVVFVSEEEELDTYKSIIKAENKDLDEESVTKKAKEQMEYDRKVVSYASSLNIKADKTLKEDYDNYISQIKSQLAQTGNADEAYKMMLSSMGYTEKAIKRIFEIDFYNNKLFEVLFNEIKPSEEEIKDFYEKNKESFVYNGIRVKHILIYTIDDYGNPLDEETKKEKKTLIDKIYKKATSGEDFDSLMKEYSEDETINDYPDGYTIAKGDMIKEFEDAAFSIENVGDVCEPVLSKYGYHIIKLEEKIPYYSLDDKEFFAFLEQNLAKENLTKKIKDN